MFEFFVLFLELLVFAGEVLDIFFELVNLIEEQQSYISGLCYYTISRF